MTKLIKTCNKSITFLLVGLRINAEYHQIKVKNKLATKTKIVPNMVGLEYFPEARLSNDGCLLRNRACSTLGANYFCSEGTRVSLREKITIQIITIRLKFGRDSVPIEDGNPDDILCP